MENPKAGTCMEPNPELAGFLASHAPEIRELVSEGVFLPDPEGRLKGGGVRVRNIRLKERKDLDDLYIRRLILEAASRARRPLQPVEPIDYVKVYEGLRRNRP